MIDLILDNDGNPSTIGFVQEKTGSTPSCNYFSSTQHNSTSAKGFSFAIDFTSNLGKADSHRVRALRSF